jgi:hypothetical protein
MKVGMQYVTVYDDCGTYPEPEKEERDSFCFLELLADRARGISLPKQFYSRFTTFTLYQSTFIFFISKLRITIWVVW